MHSRIITHKFDKINRSTDKIKLKTNQIQKENQKEKNGSSEECRAPDSRDLGIIFQPLEKQNLNIQFFFFVLNLANEHSNMTSRKIYSLLASPVLHGEGKEKHISSMRLLHNDLKEALTRSNIGRL